MENSSQRMNQLKKRSARSIIYRIRQRYLRESVSVTSENKVNVTYYSNNKEYIRKQQKGYRERQKAILKQADLLLQSVGSWIFIQENIAST